LPLLEELSNSPARTVAKHAKNSKKVLEQNAARGSQHLDYRRVNVITDIQAENCQFIKQQNCRTSRSLSKCVEWHKSKAARVGANSILVLHDSTMVGLFRSAMMANYYDCSNENLKNLAEAFVDSDQNEPEMPSYINELKELAILRDEGIITENEFQLKKSQLLGLSKDAVEE